MSRLLDHLTTLTAETESAARTAQDHAAVALAYARSEPENQAILDAALAALAVEQTDPAPILTATFVAAVAALPAERRARAMNELQSAVNSSRRLAGRAGWSILKLRIKDAAKTIDAAHAGQRNADGMAAGTVVDPSDFIGMGQAFVDQHEEQGHCKLRKWKGCWFFWKGSVYEEIDDVAMDGLAYLFLASLSVATGEGPRPLQPNKKLVEYFLHAVAPLVQVPGSSPLRWLDEDQSKRPAIDRCVFCSNGTLLVDTWIAGADGAFIAPTPALFILKTLGKPFDPTAQAPHFERFVSEIFDGDLDRIAAMKILFGYWLIASTMLQIVVIFSGLPQTGKGALLTIIQAILGVTCANPSFEQLGGNFGFEDLIGANLAILSDVHDTSGNVKSAVEKILKVSGEDSVDVTRKHKPALNGLYLPARFILAMNELVSLPDVSGALSRRLVVMPFLHSFLGKGKAGLAKEIIAAEGPGVLMWALEGLRLLTHVMRDAEAKSLPTKDTVIALLRTQAAKADHELLDDLSNPVRVFLREECHIAPERTIELNLLFSDWDSWRDTNGYMKRTRSRLVSDLHAASQARITSSQETNTDGDRPRVVKGVTLKRIVQGEVEAEKKKLVDAAEAETKKKADEVKASKKKQTDTEDSLTRLKNLFDTPSKPTPPPPPASSGTP